MSDQIAFINVRPVLLRVPLIVVAGAALFAAWCGVRWLVGNTMAESARDFETGESAVRLAPDDPYARLQLARLRRVSLLPEELPEALRQFEQAAALAPNDYLIWMELGRARASAGDAEGGIRALRRATELAPSYAQPRWHLGNVLLRDGQVDEAFAELRRAADADSSLRPQVFNLAWQVYDRDVKRVVASIGDSPTARAQLTEVLVGRGLVDEALALWATLSAEEKKQQRMGAGEKLVKALFGKKLYRAASQVLSEAGDEGAAQESVGNGGFEADIAPAGKKYFGWQVVPPEGVQVAVDPRVKHGGGRSLRLSFNVPTHVDFKGVLQLVTVEPATRYRLGFAARTEDLKSASTPVVEVLDGASGAALGASAPLAAGTSAEWQQGAVEFTTPQGAQAVMIRLTRAACPDGSCPIFGKVWYDDFDLQRVGGQPHAR
jgi:Flp pilus assembly protein TadD